MDVKAESHGIVTETKVRMYVLASYYVTGTSRWATKVASGDLSGPPCPDYLFTVSGRARTDCTRSTHRFDGIFPGRSSCLER